MANPINTWIQSCGKQPNDFMHSTIKVLLSSGTSNTRPPDAFRWNIYGTNDDIIAYFNGNVGEEEANNIPDISDVPDLWYQEYLTPFEQLGYTSDMLFIYTGTSLFPNKEVLKLEEDDGSTIPGFKSITSGQKKWVNLNDIQPCIEQKPPADWREREHQRFFKRIEIVSLSRIVGSQVSETRIELPAEYTDIPILVYDAMFQVGFIPPEEHFLHIGIDDASKVSYTESEQKGEADRQTVTTLGRYLRKFSTLDDPEIATIANLYRKEVIGDQEVKFARSREEIKRVYENGPNSCMGKTVDHFATNGIHPAEVYASPDCAIAYIERKNKDGSTRITARTVLNEIDKHYIRIYGDVDTIEPQLRKLGYTPGSLAGCNLLLLRTANEEVICPYLDGTATWVTIESSYITVDEDGDYEGASSEHGLLNNGSEYCAHCDCYHNGDVYWSDYHDMQIVGDCVEGYEEVRTGPWSTDLIHRDAEELYEYKGELYPDYGLENCDLVLLDDEVYAEEEIIYSELDDEMYVRTDPELLYFTTEDGDMDCTKDNQDELVAPQDTDGDLYHIDAVHSVKVDGDTLYYFKELPEEINAA